MATQTPYKEILRGGQNTPDDEPKPFTGAPNDAIYETASKHTPVKDATAFMFHDTAGRKWRPMVERSNANCRDNNRCLGITFTIDGIGQKRQHHSLLRRSSHGNEYNSHAHGVEVVNLFDGNQYEPAHPGQVVQLAPWLGRGKKVIVPSAAQLEAGWELVQYLAKLPIEEGGGVVLEFPGILDEGQEGAEDDFFVWQTVPGLDQKRAPGVVAHGWISDNRSDGYHQTLYVYNRSAGYTPQEAYDNVLKSSKTAFKQKVRSVDGKVHNLWVSKPLPIKPRSVLSYVVAGVATVAALGLVAVFGPKAWGFIKRLNPFR